MEDKLDNQEYISLEEFIADFQRIVDNCIKYNGPSSGENFIFFGVLTFNSG